MRAPPTPAASARSANVSWQRWRRSGRRARTPRPPPEPRWPRPPRAEASLCPADADYDDPANSYLDVVLRRRVGIPITLAVLAVEVARRADVGLHLVGMPGHVLVTSDATPGTWWDPFDGGNPLDRDGCEAI